MAQTEVRRTSSTAADQSIGDLVSEAAKDVSQLVRYEIDLAKVELKQDVRRIGIGGALLVVAAFVGCLVLVLLCFALAFGLVALGIWQWAAFLIVAGLCVLLAGIAVLIGITLVRKLDGMSKTRRSLSDDMSLLRLDRNGSNSAKSQDGRARGIRRLTGSSTAGGAKSSTQAG
jgi:uncharacterized membrane protein YqjE